MRHTISTTEQLDIRGLQYTVRRWGAADAPRLFLLHGWMDSSATFQFVVEALRHDWQVIAPDWRGFGGSTWLGRPYWFPDYYADLDALLAHYAPGEPVRLAGHSMGGNVAGIYAGLYPERVSQVAMLDFLGLRRPPDAEAPLLLQKWIAAQAEPPRLRVYPDHGALARRLCAANPRLTPERADFLARHVGRVRGDGQVEMGCDPWHKLPSPFPYRVEDAMACWRRVRAPVLLLIGDEGFVLERFGDDPAELQRRAACFADVRQVTISGAGHNVQHDQPEQVAAALESFFLREPT
ncbi:alpha/beta hydrolase [Thauera aromatica]|uniref:alpha/beta fold hydrolase n=1 Tax=Thauera aromatica TaxID=59405 RepID=UPI001FFD123E|nr:alpha/beta hydrolase [Thauera aromatica]MCK2087110.1 alpha/beta hydrolase [Thauera aromatica]MCK2127840.1 alpha/beta hydrolase [Thauera aromatica]